MPYDQYLKTKHWKRFRLKALKHHGKICMMCGEDKEKFYHVHHLTYKNRGHEQMQDVVVLCPDCHSAVHKANFEIKPESVKKLKKIKPWRSKKRKRPKEASSQLMEWFKDSVSDKYVERHDHKQDRFLGQHKIEAPQPIPERPLLKKHKMESRKLGRAKGGKAI